MLKLTFNNGFRMANCTMHGEPGTAAAFRHGESGARRRHGALVTPEGLAPSLDGDERPREFNRMEFSVMCMAATAVPRRRRATTNLLGPGHHSREEPAPFHHSRRGERRFQS